MRYFDEEKTVQVLSYLSKKGYEDFISLLKLIFFAERYSLRKYCTPVVADQFYAMKRGPVASNTYNMLKKCYLYNKEKSFLENLIIPIGETSVEIDYDGNYDLLSKSDIESLNFSITNFGSVDMVKVSHFYPEWYRCEEALNSGVKRVLMNTEDFFCNPNEEKEKLLIAYYGKEDPYKKDDVQSAKDIFFGGI